MGEILFSKGNEYYKTDGVDFWKQRKDLPHTRFCLTPKEMIGVLQFLYELSKYDFSDEAGLYAR